MAKSNNTEQLEYEYDRKPRTIQDLLQTWNTNETLRGSFRMPRLFQHGEPAAEEEALAEAYHSPTRHSTVMHTTFLSGACERTPCSGARELTCHCLALTCFFSPFRGVSQSDLDGRNVSGASFLRFQLLRA